MDDAILIEMFCRTMHMQCINNFVLFTPLFDKLDILVSFDISGLLYEVLQGFLELISPAIVGEL